MLEAPAEAQTQFFEAPPDLPTAFLDLLFGRRTGGGFFRGALGRGWRRGFPDGFRTVRGTGRTKLGRGREGAAQQEEEE